MMSPLEAVPQTSPLRIAYEFSLAVTEATAGKYRQALARYERLALWLEGPAIPDVSARNTARSAVLLGQAQAQLSLGSGRTLEYAERLRDGHPFFAAPAEGACTAYFAARGEQEAADKYRERAELAALRNGMSWSAVTILTVRMMYAHILSKNIIGLIQTTSELSRLSEAVPTLALFRDAARAYALHLSGRHDEALTLCERLLQDPRHAWLPSAFLNRAHYAEVLVALGRCQEAKAVCLETMADCKEALAVDPRHTVLAQQLALVEAELGSLTTAAAGLDRCIEALASQDNPLLIGACHRDRAKVALLAGDEHAFNHHLAAMSEHFRSTKNPWLVRQCEQLANEAHSRNMVVDLSLPPSGISNDMFETALVPVAALESDGSFTTVLD